MADTKIAAEPSITDSVMLGHYVDEELMLKSNRTFDRIVARLPTMLAERYGYCPGSPSVPHLSLPVAA